MVIERETPWGYVSIPSDLREQVDKQTPKLTWDRLKQEVLDSCDLAMFEWLTISTIALPTADEPLINTTSAKDLFNYAFCGIPFFIKRNSVTAEVTESEAVSSMLFGLDSCLKMLELPTSCSYAENSPSPGLHGVINAVAARSKLDHFRLTGTDWSLSIQEVSLLARVRELSTRNAASPKSTTPIKTFKSEDGITLIDTAEANRWLNLRRKYIPTQLPETQSQKSAMIAAIEEWVS